MAVYFAEHDVTVHHGHVLDVLPTLEAESVQCVVTSPPYYGLRDYGTGTWEGGSDECDHLAPVGGGKVKGSTLVGSGNRDGYSADGQYRQSCGKCGARRIDRQIGLESSPAEYVETMRQVFAEVRRVLRSDGVLWLNLGDSYAGSWGAQGKSPQGLHEKILEARSYAFSASRTGSIRDGMPPAKNLLGIPWRVAFALQDDGWTLRNAVIWHKPNAMPESVTDRLSTRYEHVFLFSKSRRYWFNLDPIRETPTVRPIRPSDFSKAGEAWNDGTGLQPHNGDRFPHEAGRNPGDVWSIPTSPYPGAHFAVFPRELARRCILAGTPEGSTVLDPFHGSGTTGLVARQLGRRYVGIELNPAYIDLSIQRMGQPTLDFYADQPAPAIVTVELP